jgi:hypothetical protein
VPAIAATSNFLFIYELSSKLKLKCLLYKSR